MKATVTKRFEGAQEGGMKNVGDVIDIADEARLKELEAAGVVTRGENAKASDGDDDQQQNRGGANRGQTQTRSNERLTTASYPTTGKREGPQASAGRSSSGKAGRPKAKR